MVAKVVDQYYSEFYQRVKEYLVFKNTRKKNIHLLNWKEKELRETEPIFFLSTGRTGTKFFSELFKFEKSFFSSHFPEPTFMGENVAAYMLYKKNGLLNKEINYALSQSFILAREKILHQCYLHDKKYLETNNNLTFLAPALKLLFPKSKFVFLHRHPAEFVRSGLNRNWYSQENKYDIGRIIPVEDPPEQWEQYTSVQKISWLWMETNSFILNFLDTIPKSDFFEFNFSDFDVEKISNMLSFLAINIPIKTIHNQIKTPVNKNKSSHILSFSNWSEKEKQNLISICGDIANKLGHSF